MNNTYIRFVDSGKKAYTAQGFSVPLTKRISTLENLGGRSSSFSKSIVFDGTKENNILFGHYYDVNLEESTFDRKALVEVQVIQNDEVLFEGYLRLIAITNSTNELGQHKKINYECVVYNEVGKFFQTIRNRFLSELDFTTFNHIYSASAVTASFGNTWVDGYKYTLPITDDNAYDLSDLRPSVYAKQVFDKIFANSGYGYVWDSLEDEEIQFNKVLMPYAGDGLIFQPSDYINIYAQVENVTGQSFNASVINPNTILAGTQSKWSNLIFEGFEPIPGAFANNTLIEATVIITDEGDNYSAINSRYVMPIFATGFQQFKTRIKVNVDFNLINPHSGNAIINTSPSGSFTTPEAKFGWNYNVRFIAINQNNEQLGTGLLNLGEVVSVFENSTLTSFTIAPGSNTIFSNLDFDFIITSSNLQVGDSIRVIINLEPQRINEGQINNEDFFPRWSDTPLTQTLAIDNQVVINNVELEYYPDPESLAFGAQIQLTRLLPKMQQQDFIKAIANLYNLYFDVADDNPNTIIIKTRNEYYDSGSIVDLNEEFLKDLPQRTRFADETSNKIKTIRYSEGKSIFNEAFQDIFPGETYGQASYVLDNLNLEGESVIELPFEGCQVTNTTFGAIVLAMDGFAPKQLPTLAIDGGLKNCQAYNIFDYYTLPGGQGGVGETNITQYPYAGHLNDPFAATFDLSFLFPRILGYPNTVVQTQNNLFNLHWRRTFSQINKSKILEAYFDLDEVKFKNIRLNDTVQLWNSWWNILEIVDYDASENRPTLIRLIQVDDELNLGAVSSLPGVITEDDINNGFPGLPSSPSNDGPNPNSPIPSPIISYPQSQNSPLNVIRRAFSRRKNIDNGVGNWITGKYNVVQEGADYNIINGFGNTVNTSNQVINSDYEFVTGSTLDGVFLPLSGGTLTGDLNMEDSIIETTGFLNSNTSDITQLNSIFHSFDSTITGGPVAGPASMSMILGGLQHSLQNPIWSMMMGGNLNSLLSNGTNHPTNSGVILGEGNFLRGGVNSVILGGQNNEIDPDTFALNSVIVGGQGNLMEGDVERSAIIEGFDNEMLESDNSVMLGGVINEITESNGCTLIGAGLGVIHQSIRSGIFEGTSQRIIEGNGCGIFSGLGNRITGSTRSAIIGGINNRVFSSTNSTIIGGSQTHIIFGSENSTIIGGSGGHFIDEANRSAIIGGQGLTVTENDTVAVPFLSINDFATFTPRATEPAPVAGRVYFDSVTNKLRCYDGTAWQDLF